MEKGPGTGSSSEDFEIPIFRACSGVGQTGGGDHAGDLGQPRGPGVSSPIWLSQPTGGAPSLKALAFGGSERASRLLGIEVVDIPPTRSRWST